MILELNRNGPPKQYFELPLDAQAKLDAGTVLYFQFSEIRHSYYMLVGGEWVDVKDPIVQALKGIGA